MRFYDSWCLHVRACAVTGAAGVEAPETEAVSSLEAAVGALQVSGSV